MFLKARDHTFDGGAVALRRALRSFGPILRGLLTGRCATAQRCEEITCDTDHLDGEIRAKDQSSCRQDRADDYQPCILKEHQGLVHSYRARGNIVNAAVNLPGIDNPCVRDRAEVVRAGFREQ